MDEEDDDVTYDEDFMFELEERDGVGYYDFTDTMDVEDYPRNHQNITRAQNYDVVQRNIDFIGENMTRQFLRYNVVLRSAIPQEENSIDALVFVFLNFFREIFEHFEPDLFRNNYDVIILPYYSGYTARINNNYHVNRTVNLHQAAFNFVDLQMRELGYFRINSNAEPNDVGEGTHFVNTHAERITLRRMLEAFFRGNIHNNVNAGSNEMSFIDYFGVVIYITHLGGGCYNNRTKTDIIPPFLVLNPTSSSNNCFFSCLRAGFRENKYSEDYDITTASIKDYRARIENIKGFIHIDEIDTFLSTLPPFILKIYTQEGDCLYDNSMMVTTTHKPIRLLLTQNHYFLILDENLLLDFCESCGMVKNPLLKQHKCRKVCERCNAPYQGRHKCKYDDVVRRCHLCKTRYRGLEHTCMQNAQRCAKCFEYYKRTHKCNVAKFLYSYVCEGYRTLQPAKKKKLSTTSAVVVDLETFFSQEEKKHLVYAAGWSLWHTDKPFQECDYYDFYGQTSIREFTRYVVANYEDISYVVAFKGATFDFLFIFDDLLKYSKTEWLMNSNNFFHDISFENTIIANGRLLSFDMCIGNKVIHFFDLYEFVMSSLAKAGKDFGCSIQKSFFPHKFIDCWEKIKYVGQVPDVSFFPSSHTNDPDFNLDLLKSEDGLFHLEEYSRHYLEIDVKVTLELTTKIWNFFAETFNENVFARMTLAQISFEMWNKTRNPFSVITLPRNAEEYTFWRSSFFGGRVCPYVDHYRSDFFDEEKFKRGEQTFEQVKASKKALKLVDVVSLYPHVMTSYDYPSTKYIHTKNPNDFRFLLFFNYENPPPLETFPLGIFKVDVVIPKNILYPYLPRRKDGILDWSLEGMIEGEIFNSYDLYGALLCGYKIVCVHEGYIWLNRDKIFNSYLHPLFEMKKKAQEENNETMRQLAKLMMNALFGKCAQRPTKSSYMIVDEGYMSYKQSKQIEEFFTKYEWSGFVQLPKHFILKGDDSRAFDTASKPPHIASFITGAARLHMLKLMFMIDPTLKNKKTMPKYTDTDCLHISLEDMTDELEALMGKELGMLDNDLKDGGLIVEADYLSPKMYILKYITPDNKIKHVVKGKGIPKTLLYEKMNELKEMSLGRRPEGIDFEFDTLKHITVRPNYALPEDHPSLSVRNETMKRNIKSKWAGRNFFSLDYSNIYSSTSRFSLPHGHEEL